MSQWFRHWLAYYPRAYSLGLLVLFFGGCAAFLSAIVVAFPLMLLFELIGWPMSDKAALLWAGLIALPAILGWFVHFLVRQRGLFPDRPPPSWSAWKLGIHPEGDQRTFR